MSKYEIRVGDTFGFLRVVEILKIKSTHTTATTFYKCRCLVDGIDCKKHVEIPGYYLFRNNQTYCGSITCSAQFQNLLGLRFGKWLVVTYEGCTGPEKGPYWGCVCDCGNAKVVHGRSLRRQLSKSCGCITDKSYMGLTGTYFGAIASGAKLRELEFTVSIEDCWEQFVKQEQKCALSGVLLVLTKYGTGLDGSRTNKNNGTASLDRINSDKGYTKDNIQWVHKDLNLMKRDLDDDVFINWCKLVATNRG